MNTDTTSPTETAIVQRYIDLAQEKIDAGLNRDQAAEGALRQARQDLGDANVPAALREALIRPSTAFVQTSRNGVTLTPRDVGHWKSQAAKAIRLPNLAEAPDDELDAAIDEYLLNRANAS